MIIKKISLRNLNDEVLAPNELTHMPGGAEERGCIGPSSASDNMSANYGGGLISPGTCNFIGYENLETVVQPRA